MSGPLAFVMPPPGSVPPGSIDNSELADMAALTVKVNATNASASPQDLAATADGQVLTRAASALVWATPAADAVSSVFGRAGAVAAAAGDYTAAEVDYDNSVSGLTATDVQAAIDEIVAGLGTASAEDYEEGTFTPTMSFSTPGDLVVSYTVQNGTYVKVGKMLTVQCDVSGQLTYATSSGLFQYGNFPFANNATAPAEAVAQPVTSHAWPSTATQLVASLGASSTNVIVSAQKSGTNSAFQAVDLPTGTTTRWRANLSYRTA